MRDANGYCKHIVAVLLKFAEEPGANIERQPLAGLLRGLDRDALAGMLPKRAESDSGLARWVEAELAVSMHAKTARGKRRHG